MAYKLIAAGGTFDHLHAGHKAFLLWLLDHGEKVLLGLTSDAFAASTKNTTVEPFSIRKNYLEAFFKEKGALDRVTVIPIDDIFGPLLTDKFLVDAIGVTEDTKEGGDIINQKRRELGLSILPTLQMQLHTTTSGQVISSTHIRSGVIDQEGENWVREEWKQYIYHLPKNVREKLRQPFGSILSSMPQDIIPEKTITVGDVTTKLFNMHKIRQKVSIVDFIVERTQLFHSLEELGFTNEYKQVILANPAGNITAEAWNVIENAMKNDTPTVIQVKGEEDLLVLVCILFAPLGYHIFYGQPHVGLVDVEVTLEAKNHAFELMNEFVRVEL